MRIDIRGLLALLALLLPVAASSARQYVDMGAKDDVAAYQPTVPFEVLTNDASETSLGPGIDIDGFGLFGNTLLLDTGASSIIAMNDAETTLRQNGFVTEGQIFEQGVAGFSILDVSALYKIKIAGTDGADHLLADTRIMSGQFPDLWLINGLVGMPGMVGRAVSMEIQPSSGSGDIFDLLPTVDLLFHHAVPASGGHRYSIPLTAKSFDLSSEDTVHGNDPLPTQAPLPMLSPTVGFQGRHASGNFVLDTGAAISFIAPRLATSLGLDSNGDGQFDDGDDQSFGTLPIGGIGGTVEAPVFNIDTFRLATNEGIDLVWDSVQVLVLDIHADIDGVLGADVLTSGWVDLFDPSPDTGPIKQVLFDFTQFQVEGDHGSLFLELDPNYDLAQSEGPDGDFDGDGDTDGDDLNLWQAGFGTMLGARLVDGDDNLDGVVEGADFLRWQRNISAGNISAMHDGDFNRDGEVNAADLSPWQSGFADGTYTGSDFLAWQRNLAIAGSPLASVPEPSGLLLALLTLAATAAFRPPPSLSRPPTGPPLRPGWLYSARVLPDNRSLC